MPPIPPPLAEGFTTTTAVPLYWNRYAPRAPFSRLVVLHGGPGAHHDYLLPQLLDLAQERACLFYDQRGGGRSRTEDRAPITWRTHVEDLTAVIAELAPGPLTLVGYSWGALLAMLYATEALAGRAGPEPVRLVLLDPAPISRAFRDRFEAEFAARQSGPAITALRDALAASGLRESDPVAYKQRTFELSVAGYFSHPERARDLTPFRVTGRVQQSVWESLGDFDLIPLLSAINVPTLLVHGWADPIPVESTLAAARALRARCVVLEASGHVPYVEQPDALFGAIEQFLEDTSESAALGR